MDRPTIVTFPLLSFDAPTHYLQPGWAIQHMIPLPSLADRRRDVARLMPGAPIPSGVALYEPPPDPTTLERMIAMRDLQAIVDPPAGTRRDDVLAALATPVLDAADHGDFATLDQAIRVWIGVAHPFARCAEWSVRRLSTACSLHVRATDLWDSTCTGGVIRTALVGYTVWVGIGSRLRHIATEPTFETAEARLLDAVRMCRIGTQRTVQELLIGWSDDTPYFSATIATILSLPIQVLRGPMTSAELPGARSIGAGVSVGGSSWDLPVVAEHRGDLVTRWPERVTWDDEASRAAQRQRQADGEARARARR